MRAWPRVVATALALIPVVLLAAMLVALIVRAYPAVRDQGLRELSSTNFSSLFITGTGHYGLVPAAWASILVLIIAMTLATPAALAMAIFSAEMASGLAGKALRVMMGVMAGIPPIVYALMAVVFVAPFMIPKFTGGLTYTTADPAKVGISPDNWPPAGVPWAPGALPWDPSGGNNSTLLGGILLALLVIPFMAPLIEDALRNVPHEPKQASLALGAGRWHTLTRITLPQALPGIIGAVRLGALKVTGDVMIVLFVVGYSAPTLPDPIWDVFERGGPLTATGAGLIGGLGGSNPASVHGNDFAVGYLTGVLLLLMALVIVVLTTVLEHRFRRSFAT